MKDLFVRRAYTKQGITIVVELDFIEKTVSLTDKNGDPKHWLFTGRTPEYMEGWLAILRAMEYAVAESKKVMDAITEKETEEFAKMWMALDKALPKGGKFK